MTRGPGGISRKGLKRKKERAATAVLSSIEDIGGWDFTPVASECRLNMWLHHFLRMQTPDQHAEKQESESESMKSNVIQLFRRL